MDLNALISNPAYHDLFSIIKGARNGFVYGVKIRFPHALIMSLLFGRGDWKSRIRVIYRLTKQHALNLAKFVSLYKALCVLQRRANGGKERSSDTFISGLIGGYLVFGSRTAVNEQIVLYVCSRVVAALIPRSVVPADKRQPGRPIPPDSSLFSLFSAVCWGAVMWLYKHRAETIQPGMFNSMVYLYNDSEKFKDLRTLLWSNT
ncbi:peroxisomal membrane protein 4 [Calocera cornea HHB12733]|uniref:Peroxisomal membrane protein 4 n=1 Tax=Calocera cornea HHB12733 TaxID=1353952 RepID=A0A165DGJ4_9BASI|nr:peroxisomal membrane protein 4 [Calocera cornea HHB12733]